MSKLAALQAQAAQAAAVSPDMTAAQKGGAGSRLLPAGYAFGRIVEVVEFGMHPQEFGGQAKDPAPEVQIGFALWGDGYQNEDGTPYILRPYSFAISRNEKAKAYKLFKCLNWRGTATHFGQLIGEALLVKIVHEKKSKADPSIVSRIDLTGFLPPLDPVTKAPYPIPAAPDEMYRLFLWDIPTKEGWDSIFLEGTFDDGGSKNKLQDKCLSALNFPGSPLEQLLSGATLTLPSTPAAPVQAVPALPSIPAVPTAPVVPQAYPTSPAAAVAATSPSPVAPIVTPQAPQSATGVSLPMMSHSNPVMPSLPAIPNLPVMPT